LFELGLLHAAQVVAASNRTYRQDRGSSKGGGPDRGSRLFVGSRVKVVHKDCVAL
jgi:hypothetical protein